MFDMPVNVELDISFFRNKLLQLFGNMENNAIIALRVLYGLLEFLEVILLAKTMKVESIV